MRIDNRVNWSRRGGNYCHFLLHKMNIDTIDALNQMAVSLRIRPDNFGYAGTKDRRGWTTQWVSLKKVDPRDILKAGKTVRGAYVGNFKYAQDALKLGMLRGNRFRIALRNACGTDEEIELAMTSLRDNGFINYYGLQRFGTIAVAPTHEIGKCLLQGNYYLYYMLFSSQMRIYLHFYYNITLSSLSINLGKWQEAIELILKPRPEEKDELAEARRIYAETKDAHAAYATIDRIDKPEAKLLNGLRISGDKNPLAALDHIPRNLRLMYIHAYQSFVWNHIVSRRIKQLGTNVIAGDLVYDKRDNKQDITEEAINYSVDDPNDVKDENDTISIGEVNAADSAADESENKSSQVEPTDEITEEKKSACELPAVKILTEEDLSNYTLADVIMPQPGWKVTYPPYAKAWFDEFLAKDELTTDLRQKNK